MQGSHRSQVDFLNLRGGFSLEQDTRLASEGMILRGTNVPENWRSRGSGKRMAQDEKLESPDALAVGLSSPRIEHLKLRPRHRVASQRMPM